MKTQNQLHYSYIGFIFLLLTIYFIGKCNEPEIHFFDVGDNIELIIDRKDGGMTTAHFEEIKIYYKDQKIYDKTIKNDYIEGVQLRKNNVVVLTNYMEQEILVLKIDSLLNSKNK